MLGLCCIPGTSSLDTGLAVARAMRPSIKLSSILVGLLVAEYQIRGVLEVPFLFQTWA